MPLEELCIGGTAVPDFTPLRGLPLRMVICDVRSDRDIDVLRDLAGKSLITIKDKPAAEFLKEWDAKNGPFEQWLKDTQKLPAQKQVEAVAKKLQELNPEFNGKVEHRIENGSVTLLEFRTESVSDISPVRALAKLKTLRFWGVRVGKVVDLSPLRGLPLQELMCGNQPNLSDLSPLRGMPLRDLAINFTQVADLSPLQGMPLEKLYCQRTAITDLSPLRGMPLRELVCTFKAERDAKILRSIKTLEHINNRPAVDFWKEVDVNKP
jgi:hypothetical protein